jgi:hypothetical protein
VIPGISTDSGVGLEPIPANTALGNFSGSSAIPTAQDKNQWLQWLDVPTNFMFGTISSTVISLAGDFVALEEIVNTKVANDDSRLSNAREWIAATISQAEAEAGIATDRRAFTAERVRQAIRVTQDFDPTGNIFTIGTSATAQRLRLRRRFTGAADFSQLSIDFSGDVCRIQTQQAGNNPNPISIGTNGIDRLFIGGNGFVGIGASPVSRHFEIHTSYPAIRWQVTSGITPPTYVALSRAFEIATFQSNLSPFPTFTDLVANSSQFNAHSIRFWVHTNGIADPILAATFDSSGRILLGSILDDGSSRLQMQGAMTVNGIIAAYKSFVSTSNFERFEIDTFSDTNNYRVCHRPGSLGGLPRGIVFGAYNGAGAWTPWLGLSASGYTVSQPAQFRSAIDVIDEASTIYYAIALGGI